MIKKYELRPDNAGNIGLYINDALVISNLDQLDKRNFDKEFGSLEISATSASERVDPIGPIRVPTPKTPSRRGRKLLLAQHEGIIRDMIEHDSRITATIIQNRLRAIGIKFSGISAVTNFVRFHGLKLAASDNSTDHVEANPPDRLKRFA